MTAKDRVVPFIDYLSKVVPGWSELNETKVAIVTLAMQRLVIEAEIDLEREIAVSRRGNERVL